MTKWELAVLVSERGYDMVTALEEIQEALRRGPGAYSLNGLVFSVKSQKGE